MAAQVVRVAQVTGECNHIRFQARCTVRHWQAVNACEGRHWGCTGVHGADLTARSMELACTALSQAEKNHHANLNDHLWR